MTSNFAARESTSPELAKFRANGQGSIPGLAIQHPETVYTARVNGAPASMDGVAQLTYDGGSGTLADVLQGMTVYIGSTAGARDKAILRVRKAPTETILYINQVSNVQFADNDYITIINEMRLWQRDLTMSGGIVRMDYDVNFGDYRNGGCLPRIAPLAAVLHLVGALVDDVMVYSVTFTPPSPTLTACYDGATIVSYQYTATGAATASNMDTDHPSWTYDTAGEYRWECSITDSLGRVTTSYRWIFVDPAALPFSLDDCEGSFDDADWSFSVTCLDDVDLGEVTDRALCTLYADDYYGSTAGSIGKIAGFENILASGWIDGESIDFDSESGSVSFTVRGAAYWMGKLRASPLELQSTSSAPTTWKEITDMTVDKALAHLLFWTSTAPFIMDCFLTGDENIQPIFSQPSGSLWDQISAISDKVFAIPLVNSYGQLYVEVNSQIADSSTRATFPVVMDITKADRENELELERVTTSKTAMVELSAIAGGEQVFSRAPGNTGLTFGAIQSFDDYILESQEECNRIAGCLLAMENAEYEPLEIAFPANIRLFDICPRMYATITISAVDNPRGVALTDVRLIPRRIRYQFNDGVLETVVTFELEVIGVDGVTYYPPPVVEQGVEDYGIEAFDGYGSGYFGDFPNGSLGDYFPGNILTQPPSAGCSGATRNTFSVGAWSERAVEGSERIYPLTAKLYYPCKIRAAASTYTTQLILGCKFYGDAAAHFNVYAMSAGERVLTGSISGKVVSFAPAGDTDVDGFEIAIDAGLGSEYSYRPDVAGDIISSGSVLATNETGASVATVIGDWYTIEATDGPFWVQDNNATWWSWAFQLDGNAPTLGRVEQWIGGFFSLGIPQGCLAIHPVDENHGRALFQADAEFVLFRCADAGAGAWANNGGTLGYILREGIVVGRQIDLSGATIKNVCGI